MQNRLYTAVVVVGAVLMLLLYLDGVTRGRRLESWAKVHGLASVALDVREIR